MKKIQKKSQIGRSMTEMLGVLAIIGVLSVAAVSGYRTAITRHKTNNLIEDVKLAGFLVMEGKFANLPVEEEAFIGDFTPKTKYEFLAFKESDTTFGIVATHVEENVCHETLTRKVDWLEEIRANGTDKACHDTDDNNISFFFNTALNDTYTPEDEETCRADRDCPATRPHCRNGYCTKCEEGLELTDGTCTACPQENGAVTNSKKPNLTNTGCHACGKNYLFTKRYGGTGYACSSCTLASPSASLATRSECLRCPNRCWDEVSQKCLLVAKGSKVNNNGLCNWKACASTEVVSYATIFDRSEISCKPCPVIGQLLPYTSTEQCHTCGSNYMASEDDVAGQGRNMVFCTECTNSTSYAQSKSKDECDRCPHRYFDIDAQRCLLCPTGQKASADGLSCIEE